MSTFQELKAKCLAAYSTHDTWVQQTTDSIDRLVKDINSAGNFIYEYRKYTKVKRFGTLLQLSPNAPEPKPESELFVASPEDFLLKVKFSNGVNLARAWFPIMVNDLRTLQAARNDVHHIEARTLDLLKAEANKRYAIYGVPITFDSSMERVAMRVTITELSATVELDNRQFIEAIEQE